MGPAEAGIVLRFDLVVASMVNSVPICLAVGWAKSHAAAKVISNHGRRFCPRRHTERLDRVGNAPATIARNAASRRRRVAHPTRYLLTRISAASRIEGSVTAPGSNFAPIRPP